MDLTNNVRIFCARNCVEGWEAVLNRAGNYLSAKPTFLIITPKEHPSQASSFPTGNLVDFIRGKIPFELEFLKSDLMHIE
jgi:hypothetical protein